MRITCLRVLLFLLGASIIFADVTGSISGVVTDSSGGVIQKAQVRLKSASTGLSRQVQTSADGGFEFLAVPVGEDYAVSVSASGFQSITQTNLKLLVNQKLRADVQMQPGSVSQSVTVSGSGAQVETATTQLGDVIEDKKVEALPLNGRSYLDLLGLQAGVAPVNAMGSGQAVSGNLGAGQLSVNGQREDANAFMVNGGSVEETGGNGASIIPVLDSLQEFRLITNSFDAEYGQFSGAIVNAITKSGTNEYHGTIFEFLRNDKLDARNFFDSARGAFRRNQYGFAGGGPIIMNRLFFFSDYQATREARGLSSALSLVPSESERAGDFSEASQIGYAALSGTVRGDNSANGMAATLSRRLGYTVTPGEPYWTQGCNSRAEAISGMCVFPNQVIPKSAWSSAATQLLGMIPSPTGYTSSGSPYFQTSGLATNVSDEKWAERIDLSTTNTGDWSFYYHFDDATVLNPFGQSTYPGFSSMVPSRAQQANASNTKIIDPSTVNEFRVNGTRVAFPGNVPVGGLGSVSHFGFQQGGMGLIPSRPSIEGVPTIILNQLGNTFGSAITDGSYQNAIQFSEGLTKTSGSHTMKFGGFFGYSQWNRRGGPSSNGQFTFNGGETGDDFADFLLGAPDAFVQGSAQALDARSKSGAVYAQDSLRILPNLTINYGLRWEFSQP